MGLSMYKNRQIHILGEDEADERYMYDSWELFEYMLNEDQRWINLEKIRKCISTLTYPKNEEELKYNMWTLFLFSRPLELMMGSKMIIYNFAFCQVLTGLCFLPLYANKLSTNQKINPHALTLTFSTLMVYYQNPFASLHMKGLAIFSWIYLMWFYNYEYENRAGFLSGILMYILMKYKFKI